MNRAELHLDIDRPDVALAALSPDGLTARVEEGLLIQAESTTPMGLLRTLDDVLGCLRATGID